MGHTDILGVLCDDALERFKDKIGVNMLLTTIINAAFLIFLSLFVIISITQIHPALPNFTGAQVVTDNIVFGIIGGLFLFFVTFFVKLNAAAAVVACRGPRDSEIGLGLAGKVLFRRVLAIFSTTLAQSLIFLTIVSAYLLITINNLANFSLVAVSAALLLATLIFYKTLLFFVVTFTVTEKRYFFKALFVSAKLVFVRGFWRIFAITLITATVNALAFALIFLAVHGTLTPQSIFNEPTLMDLYMRIFDPMFYISAIIACVPMLFIAPRLSLVALNIYDPPETVAPQAGLGSRSLAVIVDFLILIAVFAVMFVLALRLMDMQIERDNINIGVVTVIVLSIFTMFAVYNIFFETAFDGQTPGKKLMSLRVTMEDGTHVKPLQSVLRNVLRIVDLVSFVMIIFDKKHHRLGDVLSNTKVCFVNLENEVETDV